jgi:hypothetical protein
MKSKLCAAALSLILLLSPLLALNASAHWEFHDLSGQYRFGYTGIESAYECESEATREGMETNVTTLSSEWATSLSSAINQHNSFDNKAAIFLDDFLLLRFGQRRLCAESFREAQLENALSVR